MPDSATIFKLTSPSLCAYFNDERASRIAAVRNDESPFDKREVIDPKPRDTTQKFELLEKGFLGEVYGVVAPVCHTCSACVPLRTNIEKFSISKSQRRITGDRSNINFGLLRSNAALKQPLYALYQKYMNARHTEANSTMRKWPQSTFDHWVQRSSTALIASKEGMLAGFSLIDVGKKAFSLDYSVFNPALSRESVGKQLWLQTMQLAKRSNASHVYVGSWAAESPKLAYKANFRGLETIVDGEWVDFDPTIHTSGPNFRAMLKAEGLNL